MIGESYNHIQRRVLPLSPWLICSFLAPPNRWEQTVLGLLSYTYSPLGALSHYPSPLCYISLAHPWTLPNFGQSSRDGRAGGGWSGLQPPPGAGTHSRESGLKYGGWRWCQGWRCYWQSANASNQQHGPVSPSGDGQWATYAPPPTSTSLRPLLPSTYTSSLFPAHQLSIWGVLGLIELAQGHACRQGGEVGLVQNTSDRLCKSPAPLPVTSEAHCTTGLGCATVFSNRVRAK